MEEVNKKQFIFGSIFLLANRLQMIGDRDNQDITMKQWFLIVMISQFGETSPRLNEVAEFMGSSRQNIKQLALKLEQRGFLHIEKDKHDSRAIRLKVTAVCKVFFKERQDREIAFLKELYKDLSEEEIDHLYKGMYQLGENVFKMDELLKGGFKV